MTTSNPDGAFLETDTSNNTAWTSFRLTRDSKGNAKIAEVALRALLGHALRHAAPEPLSAAVL